MVRREMERGPCRRSGSAWLTSLDRVSERTGVAGSLANLFDPDNWLPGGKDAAFTLALIALSAKMAVADGVATASEIARLQAHRRNPARHRAAGRSRFDLAQQDVAGYEAYARKIGRFFAREPDTLEHVLDGLFFIASADGMVHEAELDYLKSVSDIFGFDDARFEQIASQHVYLDAGHRSLRRPRAGAGRRPRRGQARLPARSSPSIIPTG